MLIREVDFEECVKLSKSILEFDSPYEINEYEKWCKGVKYLSLILDINDNPVGFKIGYDHYNDGSFYSWMGGVLPDFRQNGVAKKLADFQEKWALKNGFTSIRMKTRKKHKTMIKFSLKRGFLFSREVSNKNPNETRIIMEKQLV